MDDFLGLDLWTRTGTERAKSSKYDLSSIFGPGFFVRLVFATTELLYFVIHLDELLHFYSGIHFVLHIRIFFETLLVFSVEFICYF